MKMVDTALLVAIIGVGGTLSATLIGSYVNLQKTKIQLQQENYRTMADYYLDTKIEKTFDVYRLSNDISSGFENFAFLSRKDSDISIPVEDYEEYTDSVHEYSNKCDVLKLFLTDSQQSILAKSSLIYNIVIDSIYETPEGYKIDWEEVEEQPYVRQHEPELDSFGIHSRMVQEMLHNELNVPIKDLYEDSGHNELTEEMEDYLGESKFTIYKEDELLPSENQE